MTKRELIRALHKYERVVIPALQDDRKVAVDALLAIRKTALPMSRRIADEALDRLEVDR